MTQESPEDWDVHLLTVLPGYRATIQASTKYTHFYLLHGREMALPSQNLERLPTPAAGYEDPTAHAVVDNLRPLTKALGDAKKNIERAQERQSEQYARRHLHGAKQADQDQGKAPFTPTEDKGKCPMMIPSQDECLAKTQKNEDVQDVQDKGKRPMTTAEHEEYLRQKKSQSRDAQADQVLQPRHQVKDSALDETDDEEEPEASAKRGRTDGDKKGKLVPNVEGLYQIENFTDNTHAVATVADANGTTWKKRSADLSAWII